MVSYPCRLNVLRQSRGSDAAGQFWPPLLKEVEKLHPPDDTHHGQITGVSTAKLLHGVQHSTGCGPQKRRQGMGLMVAAAAGLAVLFTSPAAALAGRVPSGKHGRAAHAGRRQAHAPNVTHASHPGSARRTYVRYGRPYPGAAPAMDSHGRATPLVNAVWDNPVLQPSVLGAIVNAAGHSDIAPDLLLALAWRESRFTPEARSTLSSATGLLQFTSGTWLQAVHQFGPQYGLADYAAAIHKDPSGEYIVQGQYSQEAVLALRNDPILSASMAGEMLKQSRSVMQASIGRSMRPADLYLTYVLGPAGAARFLTALRQSPSAPVRSVASRRVLRNAGLLAHDGRSLSVRSTYDAIRAMLDDHHARFEPVIATATKKPPSDEPHHPDEGVAAVATHADQAYAISAPSKSRSDAK